ncbi:MAG: PIG-L family deacetylase [Bacilli bacterium]|nr:PIG-L family deacetylase [Bacilli bacterium]
MDINVFKDKKIMILCPHQDDEINEAGGLLLELKKINCTVYVVYSTNGDYNYSQIIRRKEALKSLKVLGVNKNNIYFLGYPDQHPFNKDHLYMCEDSWSSNRGIKFTNTIYNDDFHFLKYKKHALLNRNSFIGDLKDVILEKYPDIIICVDFDSHCDHRALSLAFHHSMGDILKRIPKYRPIILKSFAYPTSYKSFYDFKNKILLPTRFLKEKKALYDFQNPYYKWEDRVSIDVSESTDKKLLLNNSLFKAIIKHKSQPLVQKTYSLINSDQVYFIRRTDNICLSSLITSTSGNVKYINDFMYFDSNNIMKGDLEEPILDGGIFEFDESDTKRIIRFNFKSKVNINRINIFKYVGYDKDIEKVKIMINGHNKEYNLKKNNYIYFIDNLNINEIDSIQLSFDTNIKITEIEMFELDFSLLKYEKQNIKSCNSLVFFIDDVIILLYRLKNKIYRFYLNFF